MRPILLSLSVALAACASDADPGAPDLGSDAATSASRTYTDDDRDTFCDAVLTEAFVRDHFDLSADAPLHRGGGRYFCSGYWGADSEYDAAASRYTVNLNIDDDDAVAALAFEATRTERTAAENRAEVRGALAGAAGGDATALEQDLADATTEGLAGGVGETTTDEVDGVGDEAVVVRVGGAMPSVAFRLGNVRVHGITVIPSAEGGEVRPQDVEARSVAFARALAAQM